MIEPNFCELQLQQMVNSEIFNRFHGFALSPIIPIVVPQFYEDQWGWDTGLFLPWFGRGLQNQKGCNFFIQYKLSNKYDTSSALGWESWEAPFYKFNLGYRRKRRWDFVQRNHLIELSENGFITIYVTNNVVDFSELTRIAVHGELCSELPVLQVTDVLKRHKTVTFTEHADQFCLHSEIERAERSSVIKIFESVKPTEFNNDLNTVVKVLSRFEDAIGIQENGIRQIIERLPQQNFFYLKTRVVVSLLRQYLNVDWVWIRREE